MVDHGWGPSRAKKELIVFIACCDVWAIRYEMSYDRKMGPRVQPAFFLIEKWRTNKGVKSQSMHALRAHDDDDY